MTSWRWWCGIGALPLWGALAVFLWAGWNYASNRAISRELDEIHRGGHPMHPTDGVPEFVSDDQNAALLFQQAVALTVTPPADLSPATFARDWNADPGPATRVRIRSWLDRNDLACGLVARGAKRPGSRWMIDYTRGFAVEFPHLMATQACVQSLLCRARFDFEEGRRGEAAAGIAAALRLARSVGSEPIHIMVVISVATTQMALDALQGYLSKGGPVTEGLRGALAQPQPDELQQMLAKSIDMDRATLFTWILNDPRLMQDDSVPASKLGAVVAPYFKYDLAYYSSTMRLFVRTAREPADKRAWIDPSLGERIDQGGILTQIAAPGVWNSVPRVIEGDLQIELMRACLDAIAKGTFPAIEGTRDRLGRADWKTKREGDVVTIWGVGHDLKDDGGDPKKDLVVKIRIGR